MKMLIVCCWGWQFIFAIIGGKEETITTVKQIQLNHQ